MNRQIPRTSSTLALLAAVVVLTGPSSVGFTGSAHADPQAPVAPATAVSPPPTTATAPTAPPPAGAPATPAPAAAPDLNFDLLDEGKPVAKGPSLEDLKRREHIEHLVKLRRPMLIAHQALGFITLAALTATLVIGQLNYYDKYISGDFSGRYEAAHLGLGITTSILFGGTGILAVAAPNPYPKPIKFDTALLHKVSMILATAGMLTQIILGPITSNRIGRLDQPNLALGHLVAGYATWAFMATGTIAYFF